MKKPLIFIIAVNLFLGGILMAKVDRTVFTTNDQDSGQIADPNKLEANDSHIADVVDTNDDSFQGHKSNATLDHPDGSVTTPKLADDAVTRAKVATGAIGKDELDSTLWEQTANEAKFSEIDSQLAEIVTNRISLSKITGLKTGYIAHRGYSDLAPENTLPSFLEAAKHGNIVVETDIQKTSDGIWVLMHDTTVDRTTNGTGLIADMTLAEIRALNVDFVPNWFMANPSGYYGQIKVPTLEDFLELCANNGLIPQIEVQGWNDRVSDSLELVNILKKYSIEEKSCVFSADVDFVKEVRKKSSKVYTMLTRTTLNQADIDLALEIGNCGIDTAITDVNKSTVELAHSQGIEVAVYTIDDQSYADAYFDYGVDWIATNRLTKVV